MAGTERRITEEHTDWLTTAQHELTHAMFEWDDGDDPGKLMEWTLNHAAHALERIATDARTLHDLFQFLIEWDQQDSFRDPDYRDQLADRYLAWIARAHDAIDPPAPA